MKKNLPVTDTEVPVADEANILSTTDPKGRITYVNDDFIAISGFERDELIGKAHNIVRHPDMPPAAFEDLWQTIKRGESWMGIVKNRCKNGDHYWVSAYVTPIMRDGEIVEYQSVRSKATPEQIARAKALYARLNEGRVPRGLKRRALPFQTKLVLTFALALGATLAWPVLSGRLDVASALLALLPGALIAGAFIYRELRPLCRVFRRARDIFDNPIAREVYVGSQSEVGQVLLALEYLEKETGGIVGRIADSSGKISGYADKLNASIELNQVSINSQHSETEQVATAVTEMSASIQEVANNAQLTAESANRANEEVNTSRAVVDRTMDAIHRLAEEVEQARTVIMDLSKNSERISSVVNVISDIAEQTNLLALNAAIEAARAGEQGRGFAVVADEVRTLANRTHDSTREIQEMIEQLQQGTNRAVEVMGRSSEQAGHSVERGREAVDSLEAIRQAVANINDMAAQIATAVEQQNAVAREVNQNVVNIQQTSEMSLDGINTSRGASDVMIREAEAMKVLSAQFWEKRRV